MRRLNLYEICDIAEFLRENPDQKYVDAVNITIKTLGYNGGFTLEDDDISWSGVIAKKDEGEE